MTNKNKEWPKYEDLQPIHEVYTNGDEWLKNHLNKMSSHFKELGYKPENMRVSVVNGENGKKSVIGAIYDKDKIRISDLAV